MLIAWGLETLILALAAVSFGRHLPSGRDTQAKLSGGGERSTVNGQQLMLSSALGDNNGWQLGVRGTSCEGFSCPRPPSKV
jgi:hypothetical protein